MSIKRIKDLPEGSGSLTSDDIFLFMDDPSHGGITKKISLSQISQAIGGGGGGGSANTGDITFDGSTISTANPNQSMTITTNGDGDIYIGADRNMIFDMNAFSAKGILLQDSQEDGYDDPNTPSTLKVGSIYHDTGRMIIKSDGRILQGNPEILTSNLTSIPEWLSTYAQETGFTQDGTTGNDFGFDSNGLWFTGDAQPLTQSYPVRTNFDISSESECEVIFTVNHNDGCSDHGICFFKSGDSPRWSWQGDDSRIAIQIDCPAPMIAGLSDYDGGEGNDVLIEPGYYTFKVNYNPVISKITMKVYAGQDTNGALLNTLNWNERLEPGIPYRIGFAADQDDGTTKSYFTNLTISTKNLVQTYGGLWLTNGDDTGVSIPAPIGSQIGGDIAIRNKGSEWLFKNDTIDLHNGGIQNAQVFQFNDQIKQAVITGPTPSNGDNAQRLIIQGQRGQGNGEGGDVYFWAGDADTNGGDIKIYAGDADNVESGQGGYINIDAGNGFDQGGNISISAGNSTNNGGNISISAGSSPSSPGQININSNTHQWLFDYHGNLNLPEGKTLNFGQNNDTLGPPVAGGGTDKVRLWDFKGNGSNFNYAIGAEANHVWFAMDVNNGDGGFKFYSRDNEIFKISDDSRLMFPNGTTISQGSFDIGMGGSSGISLNCSVGYELNWQAGHLRNVQIGDPSGIPQIIYTDSPLQFPGTGQEYMTINSSGITFPDGSTQTKASTGSATTVIDLSYNTVISTNAGSGDIFDITLTGDIILENPTNAINGKTLRWRILQDSNGNRSVTLGEKFVIPSSASNPLPWSTSANAMDILAATYHAGRDKWDIVAFVPGY